MSTITTDDVISTTDEHGITKRRHADGRGASKGRATRRCHRAPGRAARGGAEGLAGWLAGGQERRPVRVSLVTCHGLIPAAQVEWDRALDGGEKPPCRALVLAGPMAGDWCWRLFLATPSVGIAIVLEVGPEVGTLIESAIKVVRFDEDAHLGDWGIYTSARWHAPIYRRWAP